MPRSERPSYLKLIHALESRGQFRINPGLERIRAVLRVMGDPQEAVPMIHIAGTNGKGSVAATLESMHRAAGRRTGLYTSPHLIDLCERIQIGGMPIRAAAFERLARQVIEAESRAHVSLTYFEFTTALAFVAFREAHCELVILETGLGGLWDATNVVRQPVACVITSIGMDHAEWLGNTVAKIASQKAGILKPGVPAWTSARGAALAVIRRVARDAAAPLTVLGRDVLVERLQMARPLRPGRFAVRRKGSRSVWSCALLGEHQIENAALAVSCALSLQSHPLSDAAIRRGLLRVDWPGRMQWEAVEGTPVLFDGAHNLPAANALARTLREFELKKSQNLLMYSAYRDKDYRLILKLLSRVASDVVLTTLPSARGASLEQLRIAAKPYFKTVHTVPDLPRAFAQTLRMAGARRVLVTGSLALVGDTLRLLHLPTKRPVCAPRSSRGARA